MAEIRAINGHGTARSVAGLFAALVSGQVLSQELFELMRTTAVHGIDKVIAEEVQWGLGVRLDDGFGMGGTGGNLGWYSTAGGYAIGFLTGLVADHDRVTLVEKLYAAASGSRPCWSPLTSTSSGTNSPRVSKSCALHRALQRR
jgi:hypothetical protein